ncbi:metal ABC transporter permease, partial [Salmonella sp. L-S2906]
TKRFERMLLVSALVAVSTSLAGIYLSFFLDSAPAPTIVLLLTASFILAFVFSRKAAAASAQAQAAE